ncbi:sugar ABC transporter ATP-binding protein [Arthrobacter sp. 2YAF22_2]|uniref:sugar ABC transporter ATP-binding protein n=1 Tax=Arthrobacter sp. 2YAF22_2 TaxID=3233029 RepID=UPI003F918DE5
MTDQPSGLVLAGVSKRFGATRALVHGELHLRPGEIHTLLGENGSGKSTLVKIIGGVHRPDSGTVTLDGIPVTSRSPRAAMDLDIATVFQEVLTAGSQSVLENVWLGSHGMFRRRLGRAEQRSIAQDVLTRIAGEIPLDLPAGQLSLSGRQSLCIARALVRNPKVLILDESTASLDVSSRDRLFTEMRRLAAKGTAILFISHRMDEVAEISDRVTVLRSGQSVSTVERSDLSISRLISDMTGNSGPDDDTRRQPHTPGDTVLQGAAIRLAPASAPIDFELRAGEIVGLAGLEGHGQDHFIKRLAGVADGPGSVARLLAEGAVELNEHNGDVLGVAYLPRERRGESLFESMSIRENFALPTMAKDTRGGLLGTRSAVRRFDAFAQLLSLRFGSSQDAISTLSGGNQQKVLLARWLATDPKVLLLNDPTRGVDIGTKREIYAILHRLSAEGMSIVVLSSEVDELVDLADRVLVFRDQAVFAQIPHTQLSTESIVAAYFGQKSEVLT